MEDASPDHAVAAGAARQHAPGEAPSPPRRGRVSRVWLVLLGLAALAVAAAGAWYSAGYPADATSYRIQEEGTALQVTVYGGDNDCEGGLREPFVEESDERIDVSIRRDRLPPSLLGQVCHPILEVSSVRVELDEPLGDRPVYINGERARKLGPHEHG